MVGHLVPQGTTEAWNVLLKLVSVSEYCTSKTITQELAMFLADLIEDFLEMYYQIFPDMSVKPKFHYLTHYPELMLEFGPLIHAWTLRFEGQHDYFKQISRTTKNRKNMYKTLDFRHEYMQASWRNSKSILSEDVVQNTGGQPFPVRLLPLQMQRLLLPIVGASETVYRVEKMQFNGTWYATGLGVICTANDNGYQFARIEMCVIIGGNPYLLCHLGRTLEYIPHFHAFSVDFGTDTVSLWRLNELYDHYPLGIYKAGNMNDIFYRSIDPTLHNLCKGPYGG